jgi:hypothetical protein
MTYIYTTIGIYAKNPLIIDFLGSFQFFGTTTAVCTGLVWPFGPDISS